MLDERGQSLLGAGVGLVAGGLILAIPGAVLVGAGLLGATLLAIERLKDDLGPLGAPWGLHAKVAPPDVAASSAGLKVRSHRVDQRVDLELDLHVPAEHAGLSFEIESWETTEGLTIVSADRRVVVGRDGRRVRLQAVANSAAVHRLFGVRGTLTDAMGLVATECFLPCPYEVAALPRSQHLDLRRLTETRRRAARSAAGLRPDSVAGHGDELRELREHAWGDPFKHIAWKASARRGRLMVRSFERERSRALYAVVDTGATMRDGRLGDGPLDQAFDMTHSLAELAARQSLPFGAALVDGEVTARVPVREGLASLNATDRALLDVRRTVAEPLSPLSDDALLQVVAAYLRSVERVDLGSGEGFGDAYVRFRQRTVMAALARLPERERLPSMKGAEPSPRADLSILRRFCRAMDLALPYRDPLPPEQRIQGITRGLEVAAAARNGPFVIVVISDFRGLRGACDPVFAAFARARRAGHRIVVVAVRDVEPNEAYEYVHDAEDIDTARGLAQADRAARIRLLEELNSGCRRAGAALLADPDPEKLVALWARAAV